MGGSRCRVGVGATRTPGAPVNPGLGWGRADPRGPSGSRSGGLASVSIGSMTLCSWLEARTQGPISRQRSPDVFSCRTETKEMGPEPHVGSGQGWVGVSPVPGPTLKCSTDNKRNDIPAAPLDVPGEGDLATVPPDTSSNSPQSSGCYVVGCEAS